jgi:hypothetical protein
MNQPSSIFAKHKYCALVSLAMVVLAMLPQLHLWLVRGRDWNGAYVQIQGDEPLYAAYINSLSHGRSRRNDPYGGRDDAPGAQLPESTFSIQFLPAYVIAYGARVCGASASTAMIVLLGIAGLFASIALYWLFKSVTGASDLAAAGTLFVLCVGGLAGGHALFGLLLVTKDLSMPSLPFLRRYQPAASFPLFILFIGLVWRAMTVEKRRALVSLLAGATFAALIFSYLYFWTAAAAWLLIFGALWLYFRRDEKANVLTSVGNIAAVAAIAFAPYAYLVSHRPATLDEQQTLVLTHRPDLFRVPELLGVVTLTILVLAILRGRVKTNDPRFVFAASLALLPLIVFNQQIITGRMMQPYHFAAFVVNYTVLVALIVTFKLCANQTSRRALVWIGVLSFMWGMVEVGLPSRLNTVPAAVANDQIVPVLRRLDELSKQDGTLSDLKTKGHAEAIVFSPSLNVSVLLPAWASQPTLLDIGGLDFGSETRDARKEYFFMHLYYANADIEALRQALRGAPNDPTMNYYARAVLFGHERIVPALAADFKPIQDEEIEDQVRAYQAYAGSFSSAQAAKRPLAYVVTDANVNFDFGNIDRWYDRDGGERFGNYVLYRVRLKR